MIDVHCHFDMAKNPEKYILANENNRIITIGMTNLPSHFQMGINIVKRYNNIRLALGLHPLLANDHSQEYFKFEKYVNETSYIGEVGLDFSREGFPTKDIQIKSFEFVLDCIRSKNKIISLHTRRAEKETLEMLNERNIRNAIFHWYSGSISILRKIVDSEFYFSINAAMIRSESGRKIISEIPKEYILTETDFPYIKNSDINQVHIYLSNLWKISIENVDQIIKYNFKRLILQIK